MFFDEDKAQRNVRLVLAFASARNALFVVPVLLPYFREELGLTFHQFILTEAAFAASLVTFEVPSGWLADRWKRSSTLRLSALLWSVGIILLWTADSFLQAALAQAVMGFAQSLGSGTDSALLFDSLKAVGREKDYLRYESRKHGFGLGTLAVASLFSGVLYSLSPNVVFAFDLGSFMICGIISLFLVEPPRGDEEAQSETGWSILIGAFNDIKSDAVLPRLLCVGAGIFGATSVATWSHQAYYVSLGVPVTWFGPLASCGFLIASLGSFSMPRFSRFVGVNAQFFWYWLAAVSALFTAGIGHAVWFIPLLFVTPLVWGMGGPALVEQINTRVPSARRATVLSLAAVSQRFVFIPLAHLIGIVVDAEGAGVATLGLGTFILVFGGSALIALFVFRSDRVVQKI